MLQAEMSQDVVVHGALCASFPADHSVEAAEVPTPPTQEVLPKATGDEKNKEQERGAEHDWGVL
jgi:hypothetical protein